MAEGEPFSGDFIEILQAWLTEHRRSPLDGTVSCKTCRAIVLEENARDHYLWHYYGNAPCGTPAAYERHRVRGEDCAKCRAGAARSKREARRG